MELALATKTSLEAAVEAENWAKAFRLAKEIAAQFPPDTPVAIWVCDLIGWQWGDEGRAEATALFILPAIQPKVEQRKLVTNAAKLVADKYIGKDGSAPVPKAKPAYEFNSVEQDLKSAQAKLAEAQKELASLKSPTLSAEDLKLPSRGAPVVPNIRWLEEQGFEIDVKPPYKVAKTLANAKLAVRLQGYVCSYNEFTGKSLVLDAKGKEQQLSDELVVMIRDDFGPAFGFDPGKTYTYDAMESLCFKHRLNPVTKWLESLEWDGVPRLDTWLIDFADARDTPLNRAFARKSICALRRRAFDPGCKFDHVLVLEGDEGIRKSALIRALVSGPGPEYFSDETILDKPTRDQQELTKGIWGFEIAELSGLSKSENEKVKGFVTRQQDQARPAYGRYRVDQKRSCVFFGTTNELDTYLMSQTGNRRWWPVRCNEDIDPETPLDVDGFLAVRDQLFAEAAVVEAEENLFIGADLYDAFKTLQEKRRNRYAWEDDLVAALGKEAMEERHLLRIRQGAVPGQPAFVSDEWRVHTHYIFETILRMSGGSLNDRHTKSLPGILRRYGWEKAEGNIRIGKVSRPGYIFRVLQISSEGSGASEKM